MKFLSTANFLEGWMMWTKLQSKCSWDSQQLSRGGRRMWECFCFTVNEGTLSGLLKYHQDPTLPEGSKSNTLILKGKGSWYVLQKLDKKTHLLNWPACPPNGIFFSLYTAVSQLKCIITEMNRSVHNSQLEFNNQRIVINTQANLLSVMRGKCKQRMPETQTLKIYVLLP